MAWARDFGGDEMRERVKAADNGTRSGRSTYYMTSPKSLGKLSSDKFNLHSRVRRLAPCSRRSPNRGNHSCSIHEPMSTLVLLKQSNDRIIRWCQTMRCFCWWLTKQQLRQRRVFSQCNSSSCVLKHRVIICTITVDQWGISGRHWEDNSLKRRSECLPHCSKLVSAGFRSKGIWRDASQRRAALVTRR